MCGYGVARPVRNVATDSLQFVVSTFFDVSFGIRREKLDIIAAIFYRIKIPLTCFFLSENAL
jgi:hypothetical protein